MDCRRWSVLALSLLMGGAGCVSRGSLPVESPAAAVPENAEVRKEKHRPKRKPKAETCVAFGKMREDEAAAETLSQAQRDVSLDQARKAYQQALDLDPDNLPAVQSLARLYVKMNDHDRSVLTYQKAIKGHPKEVSLRSELGMCHARHKEWGPALKQFKAALELDPENRQMRNQLGHCLARAGYIQESLDCFTKTVGQARAHYNVARMLFHMQQPQLGKQHLHLALQQDPKLDEARELLVQIEGGRAPQTVVPAGFSGRR
jgi:tetratricopeptide (TPR) repeat protein